MRILVRRARDKLFYGGLQEGSNQPNWVDDPAKAYCFSDTLNAFDYCLNNGSRRQELHIYLSTPADSRDLKLARERDNKQGGSKLEENLDQPDKGKE